MLIDELIEKAFSEGYEYALEEQREFAKIRQATKYAKRLTKEALKNGGNVEKMGRRTTQLQRLGYKIPTEKSLDRVSSVVMNTSSKFAKKHGIPFDKSMKELYKNNSREAAQYAHDLSTKKGFKPRGISGL